MRTISRNKENLYSLIYVFSAASCFIILDAILFWLGDLAVFPLLHWFNELDWYLELGLLIIGGSFILMSLFSLTNTVATIISHYVFRDFPLNHFTFTVGVLLGLANIAMNIVYTWNQFTPVGFLRSLEFVLLFVFIWIRASLPRYRYDQLMRIGWKFFLPLSLIWVVLTASLLMITDNLPG